MSTPGRRPYESVGAALIVAERLRQIEQEGWTPEHDAEHDTEALAFAAVCYAMPAPHRGVKRVSVQFRESGRWEGVKREVPWHWPWAGMFWKPKPDDRVRELVKAGALIAAEIDRLRAVENGPYPP